MIARCSCGRVEYRIAGRPIVSLICFCNDCQRGSERLEKLPRAHPIRDSDRGTAYVVYRKDRVQCVKGVELLEHHKLRERSATNRVVASCCNSPMIMWFEDAKHWLPVYRASLAEAAPSADMRICTKSAPSAARDSDIPSYAGYPAKLLGKLLAARIAMLVGS